MIRLYALLLYLLPRSFHREYRIELLQVAKAALDRADITGGRLVADLFRTAAREWVDAARNGLRRPRFAVGRDSSRDLRYAVRMLAGAPGFTLCATLTLALAIGANTATFSLTRATLLRPIAVADPDRLASWTWTSAYPDFLEYTKRSDVFDGVMAWSGASRVNLQVSGSSEPATALFLSGNAFSVLGVSSAAGRPLLPADDVRNGPIVAVLNYEYWRSRFGGDAGIIGQQLRLNDQSVTIVGVAQDRFRGLSLGSRPSMYLTLSASGPIRGGFYDQRKLFDTTNWVWLNVVGRLRPDASLQQASAAIDALYRQLHPPKDPGKPDPLALTPLNIRALGSDNPQAIRQFVLLLVGVAGLTLLLGCANLASLLVARSTSRRHEIGVRLAMGATRGQVVRQSMVESLLLAAFGGAAGVAVAAGAFQLLKTYQLPGGVGIGTLPLVVDTAALAATVVVALVTAVLFGAAPAWHAARGDGMLTLRDDVRTVVASARVRGALVAAQMAVSLVLLVGSGLFLKSLMRAWSMPTGFDAAGAVSATVNPGLARFDEPRARAYYDDALERAQALPGVAAAAWTNIIPSNGIMMNQVDVEGYRAPDGKPPTFYVSLVGPAYFAAAGTRLIDGRSFSSDDHAAAPLVAIVSKTAADTFWPGRSPIGMRMGADDTGVWRTIVGVAEDVTVRELGERSVPYAFYPFDQRAGTMGGFADPAHLLVRVEGDPQPFLGLLASQLRAVDAQMPVYDVVTFAEHVRELVMPQQLGATLLALFSLLALSLASVGTYGIASYIAQSRTRELGIRIALGANARHVRRMVLAHGVLPAGAGIVAGIALALWAAQAARAFLFDVSPSDPMTFAVGSVALLAMALLATWLPARRAARLDPVAALRVE